VVTMSKRLISLEDQTGQTMAEYAVVLGMITFTIVATFSLLSDQIQIAFERTVAIISSIA
jgi:Flp pilus assembly pilin Flp